VSLGQILPHIREVGEIGLEDLPALIHLLKTVFEVPDRVATTERKKWQIEQKNPKFSQYTAEFQVIAADVDWNPLALRNGILMVLSKEMNDSFTYGVLPEGLPAFPTVFQKLENLIRQRPAEMAAQNPGGGIGFATSPKPPAPPKDPAGAPSGTVAGYT